MSALIESSQNTISDLIENLEINFHSRSFCPIFGGQQTLYVCLTICQSLCPSRGHPICWIPVNLRVGLQSGDREGPKKELNPLRSRAPQSQANAEGVDLAGRVNTILFSRTICYIGLEQAGGHGGRPPPSPPSLSLPFPLSPPFAASLPPLIGWPQTLSFPWDFPASALRRVAADASRLSPWPSEGGVQAKRHFVWGETVRCNLCCGFSGQEQIKKRVLCLPFFIILLIFSFLFQMCFLSLLPVLICLVLLVSFICMSAFIFFRLSLSHSSSSFILENSVLWNWASNRLPIWTLDLDKWEHDAEKVL